MTRLLRLKEVHESSGRFKGDRHVPKGSSEARSVRGEGTIRDVGENVFATCTEFGVVGTSSARGSAADRLVLIDCQLLE